MLSSLAQAAAVALEEKLILCRISLRSLGLRNTTKPASEMRRSGAAVRAQRSRRRKSSSRVLGGCHASSCSAASTAAGSS